MENRKEWYEVYRVKRDRSTETIADFDTHDQAKDFVWGRSLKYKETCFIDNWEMGEENTPQIIYNQ
jgi:hypothetical protein